jgi:hypothetical protein
VCAALAAFWIGLVMLLGVTVVVADPGPIPLHGPMSEPSQEACPVTLPNGMTPPAEEPSPGHHGNGPLYTSLWPQGEILADPRFVEADGSISMKSWAWRAPGVGRAGDLEITGHELTTRALIRSSIPEGYGQRFQATGIYFPDEGCYEITLRFGDATLSFVTKVTRAETPAVTP